MESKDCGFEIKYRPNPKRWAENYIGVDNPITNINNWSKEIKYLENGQLSEEIKNIPKDYGGIYMFYLKGISLPFTENYILYIGRARKTATENINARAKHYMYDKESRINIKTMFEMWGDILYYRYYIDTDNDKIDNNEVLLIRSIVPPFNLEIPKKLDVQPDINAF